MTTGVKVVSLNTGDTTITLDTEGYVPAGVLFFGAHEGADFATRFVGCSDGFRQWATAEYIRSGVTSSVNGMTGLINRSDYAIVLLNRSSTTPIVDATAKVTSFAVNTINLTWDHNVSAGSWPITAVVFYGTQFTIRAGIAKASSSLPAVVDSDPYFTNVIGFQPDCVMLASGGYKQFTNTLPASVNKNLGFSHYWSFGWAVYPIPSYNPPGDGLAGLVGGNGGVQRGTASGAFYNDQYRYKTNMIFQCGVTGGLGNFGLVITRLTNGFGLAHGVAHADITQTFGYFAIKWKTGRFVTGWLKPTHSAVSDVFTRWGGTYDSGSVDHDPSNHANPSAAFFFLNNLRPEVSSFSSSSYTFAFADDDGNMKGYAYGGGPNNTNIAYSGGSPTQEKVTQLASGHIDLLGLTGTSPVTRMELTSWDGDGITVAYSTVPPSASFRWPYLALTQDTGFDKVDTRISATEGLDTCSMNTLANSRSVEVAITERADSASFSLVVTDGVTFDVTEPNDTWLSTGRQGSMTTSADAEYIYVPTEVLTLPVPQEYLLILQQSDVNLHVDAEDRIIPVYTEDRIILVPPVDDEGPYV